MFRHSYVKLSLGLAILWQFFGSLYYVGRISRNSARELMAEQRQLHDAPVHVTSKEDAMNLPQVPAINGTRPRRDGETKDSEPPKKALEYSAVSASNLRHGWKPVVKHPPDLPTTPPRSALNATTLFSIRNECFPGNSVKWIMGEKFSNNADGITPQLSDDLLEGPRDFRRLPSLFDQTLCHEDSPLRKFSSRTMSGTGDVDHLASVEDWYHRFLYLALHWKFHRPALDEHRLRKQCSLKDAEDGTDWLLSFRDHHGIGNMDFECPDAKFIVIPVGSIGFGAFLNTQASLNIMLALRTNRIPIFSSRSFFPWQKRKGKQDPWLLAPSRCDRKDLQCYFLPLSPCTVTEEDLENAPIYGSDRKEQKFLGVNVTIPPELEEAKVVVLNPGLQYKTNDTPDMRKIASEAIRELLDEWKSSRKDNDIPWTDQDWERMELANKWVTEKTETDPVGLLRQVYVYMLRPNPEYKNILEKQMSAIVPQAIDPSETLGLAIRGSDKCNSESMCLSFDRYMELVTDVAYPALLSSRNTTVLPPIDTGIRPNLIMTTEDPQVFKDSLAYQFNESFPFKFLVNSNDNMQGSGYPKDFSAGEEEKTIVSSLTALQFHFHAGRVYLNCCSNFHLVLNYLLQGQCGARRHGHDFVFGKDLAAPAARPSPVAQCLNTDDMPRRFRICCGWSRKKDGICQDIWKEYWAERNTTKAAISR